jgi:hypothetical protein
MFFVIKGFLLICVRNRAFAGISLLSHDVGRPRAEARKKDKLPETQKARFCQFPIFLRF